jgi:hypothetical protein
VTRARDEAILTVTFHFHFGLVFLGRRHCRRHSVISWVAPGPSGSDVKLTADRSDGIIRQSYGVVLFTLVSRVFKLKKSFFAAPRMCRFYEFLHCARLACVYLCLSSSVFGVNGSGELDHNLSGLLTACGEGRADSLIANQFSICSFTYVSSSSPGQKCIEVS